MWGCEHRDEFGYGGVWTWTAICADTKIVPPGWWVSAPQKTPKFSYGTWHLGWLFPSRELLERTRSCDVVQSRTVSEMTDR
jgi:hypothetical protein